MSDRRLRELERRWLGGERDDETEAAFVQELLRRGQLPRPRLLLAAYLGSPGAARYLGERGFPEEESLYSWIAGLGKGRLARAPELARESAVRAGLAVARLLDAHQALVDEDRPALEALEGWLASSNLERPEAAAHRAAQMAGTSLGVFLAGTVLAKDCERAARAAAAFAKDASKALKGKVRHQRKAVRQEVYEALVTWVLMCE